MKKVVGMVGILALLKLVVFLVEARWSLFSKSVAAFDVTLPAQLTAQSPFVVLAVVGVLCVAFGIFFADKTLVLMPILLCAAEVSALVPLLGLEQISAFTSFSQVGVLSSALAVVGAFILKDSNSVWRIREGRIGVIWKLIVAIEAINLGLYVFFSYYPLLAVGLPVLILALAIGGGVLIWISEMADAVAAKASENEERAASVPGLNAQISKLTAERGEAVKSVDSWKNQCSLAREDRDVAKRRITALEATLAERAETIRRLEDLLKARDGSEEETPKPAIAKAA